MRDFKKNLQKKFAEIKIIPIFASAFEENAQLRTSGAVVQLVRIRACHARGRGFEPHPHRSLQEKLFRLSGRVFVYTHIHKVAVF